MAELAAIIEQIETVTQQGLNSPQLTPVGGGSINRAYQLSSAEHHYFIKVNAPQLADMFAAEAEGLAEMRSLQCVRIPEVICYGETASNSYLVLEYIALQSLRGKASQLLGRQLAQLHHHRQDYFGWQRDNTIGSTPQANPRDSDWLSFWQQQRLAKQFALAASNGFTGSLQDRGQQLLSQFHYFFDNYAVIPALLHGDLWGGNAAADQQGQPVLFDPACYYGDRETDIAMTELFGGFDRDFYAAYQAEYPLDPGYKTRKTLYNLYHIVNHLNLFGGSYLSQAENMINQLLSEI